MHFQVLTPKSSLIEEIYICQADYRHSHKDLLFMWSATCPHHQILLLGLFGQTRLFTKHICRQLTYVLISDSKSSLNDPKKTDDPQDDDEEEDGENGGAGDEEEGGEEEGDEEGEESGQEEGEEEEEEEDEPPTTRSQARKRRPRKD